MDNKTKLVTIKEAAAMLGVTTLTLRNWDKAGKLSAQRHPLNNYRVYKREDIEKLIEFISSNTKVSHQHRVGTKKLSVKHLDEGAS